jgi:hypothetical protein
MSAKSTLTVVFWDCRWKSLLPRSAMILSAMLGEQNRFR